MDAEPADARILDAIGERGRRGLGGIEGRPLILDHEPHLVRSDFEGEVDEILGEQGKVRLITTIFGRPTPLELEYWQIEKA